MDLSRHPDPFRAAPQRFPQPCGRRVETFPLDALRHAPLRGGCSGDFVFYCIPQSKRSVYLMPCYPFVAGLLTILFHWAAERKKPSC